jgi:hypothetical protein
MMQVVAEIISIVQSTISTIKVRREENRFPFNYARESDSIQHRKQTKGNHEQAEHTTM